MTIDEYHREFPNCAICNYPETVIHHIVLKGMGGSRLRDVKGNWIPLCSIHHKMAHHLVMNRPLSPEELFIAKARLEKGKEEEIIFGAKGGLAHLKKEARLK